MIETEQQYQLTKAQANGFARTLRSLRQRVEPIDGIHPRIAKAQEDAVRSQLADLECELREYESQKADKLRVDGPELVTATQVWKIRSGREGEHEKEFLAQGMVAVRSASYEHDRRACIPLGDLRGLQSFGEARDMVAKVHSDEPPARIRNWARYAWYFAHEMREDALVVMPHQGEPCFSLGEVSGEYVFRPERGEWPHVRPVKWLAVKLPDSSVAPDLRRSIHAPGTIHRVKSHNAEARLRALQDQ